MQIKKVILAAPSKGQTWCKREEWEIKKLASILLKPNGNELKRRRRSGEVADEDARHLVDRLRLAHLSGKRRLLHQDLRRRRRHQLQLAGKPRQL